MSLKTTKEQLVQLLADTDNKVVALSGKWGTGKSFMWDQVQQASSDEAVKGALYASLFGVSSIDQVKLKLIQSSAKAAESYPVLFRSAKQALQTGIKALEGFHRGFGALNDIGLLLAPALLRQKVLVLDDIERKHEKLSIDEVLGFIDEFTKQHSSRVVLILNDDQLEKRDVWNTLREKVIDQDLRLTTSALEAFEIGIRLSPSPWASQIRSNIERCGVTNIRIVCRVVKVVNRILGNRQGLNDAVLSRVIPSTVLLAAIHYKGIEDGPDIDFVLAQGTADDWSVILPDDEPETDEQRRKSKWKILLNLLGIHGCDEYELLVVEFLQSGLFDVAKVAQVIDRYVVEVEALTARDQCNKFLESSVWDHRLTEPQLLDQGASLVNKANLFDHYMATALHDTLAELPGGQSLADAVLDRWIGALRTRSPEEASQRNSFRRKIHPRIQAAFKEINDKVQTDTSFVDACEYIIKNNGWGPRQELAMKSATVEQIETTIRSISISGLQELMAKMVDLCVRKEAHLNSFGSAMDNFAAACKSIVQDSSTPRLAKLVRSLFADQNILGLLNLPALPQTEQTVQTATAAPAPSPRN